MLWHRMTPMRWLTVVMAVAVVLALMACSSAAPPAPTTKPAAQAGAPTAAAPAEAAKPATGTKKKVVIGAAPTSDMALNILSVKKGFMEKQGLDAELKIFDSSPQVLEAVVAGQSDISANTEPPQLSARARGGKIVQVVTAFLSGKNNLSVARTDAIKKNEDFIGKNIGVQKGSGAHFHLAWFLDRYKIPADKVTIKFMDAPDQIAALARNDIQAFFSWEPYGTKAAQTVPNAKIWSRTEDDGFDFQDNIVMREDLARNDKDTATKIVKALIETVDWMNANPQEAANTANEVLRAPSAKDALDQIQLFRWQGNFMKKVVDQEIKIAEWGAKNQVFPAPDPAKLVGEIVYPDLIKSAAPNRTDM